MRSLMTVEDLFWHSEAGVIVSGANNQLTMLSREQIVQLVGKVIAIESNGEKKTYQVHGVDVAKSMIGGVNVSISLGTKAELSEIKKGATVWLQSAGT